MSRLPLYVYLAVYVFTCLIGAVFLMFSQTFGALAQFFNGARAFWLTPEDIFFDLILLIVAPALLVVGYEFGARTYRPRASAPARPRSEGSWVPVLFLWAASAIVATISLARGSAFHNIAAWGNYRKWVFARWQLFDTLSFGEFVNIYNFLPVVTALLLLRVFESRLPRSRRALVAAAVAAPAVITSVMLFQKKALLLFVLLVSLAALISRDLLQTVTTGRGARLLAVSGACAYVLYCILVTGPALSRQAQAMSPPPVVTAAARASSEISPPRPPERTTSPERPAPRTDAVAPTPAPTPRGPATRTPQASSTTRPEAPPSPVLPPTPESRAVASAEPTVGPTGKPLPTDNARRRFVRVTVESLLPGRWIGVPPGASVTPQDLSRRPGWLSYVILGPTVRTPLPALAYPAVYPRQIPFYGLDAGLDMFGVGQMPRDNLYLHRLLWPEISGGTIMVPAQFALFSQIGLGGSLVLSFVIGYLMAVVWIRLLDGLSGNVRAVGCTLMLMLAVSLAGDSLRNSLLASYGVVWGWMVVAAWYVLSRVSLRMGSAVHARARDSA